MPLTCEREYKMISVRYLKILVFISVFGFVSVSSAEVAFVTDELLLGLFANENATGKRLKSLQSGQQLEVVQRTSSYAKVRTRDGVTGWVKAAYIVTEKPAKLRVSELERDNQALTKALQEVKQKLARPEAIAAEEKAALRSQLERREQQLGNANQAVAKLTEELQDTRLELIKYKPTEQEIDPRWWYLLGGSLVFFVGIFMGMRIVEKRVRKRLSGFRLG